MVLIGQDKAADHQAYGSYKKKPQYIMLHNCNGNTGNEIIDDKDQTEYADEHCQIFGFFFVLYIL